MRSGDQEALRLAKGLRDGTLLLSERDEAAEWLERLHVEREADRALMREALEALNYIVGTSAAMTSQQENCWPVMRAAISKLRARVG